MTRMAFFIGFIEDEFSQTNAEEFLRGVISLGPVDEEFLAPLTYWKTLDYERQWRQGLLRILSGSESSCLITAMYDPSCANFITWWPLYRLGDLMVVQNQILFLDRLTDGFDECNPYRHVGTRQSVSDEGSAISEWTVPLMDVQRFCDREGDF